MSGTEPPECDPEESAESSPPPPPGLRTHEFEVGEERFVVFSYPVEKAKAASQLTEAETAVALLVLRGLSNAEIAYVRGATARTVANQLASIYRKLGVGSRVELAARLSSTPWGHGGQGED